MVAYGAFVLTTFVPVQALMLVLALAVTLLLDAPRWAAIRPDLPRPRRVFVIARRHVIVSIVAILATAYVWLPDLAALRHAGADLASYGTGTLTTKGKLEGTFSVATGEFKGKVYARK